VTGACKVQYAFAQIVWVGRKGGDPTGGGPSNPFGGWGYKLTFSSMIFLMEIVVVTCKCTQIFSLLQTTCRSDNCSYSNLSSFAFHCALAFAIERKIALAGDACSKQSLIIF
jgi:hypothetical protein